MSNHDLVYRLRKRAEIRRQIPDRKSVQEGQPDRIADLLEEAADALEKLDKHEPVAWREVAGKTTKYYDYNEEGRGEPLYAAPQPDLARVGEVGIWGEEIKND